MAFTQVIHKLFAVLPIVGHVLIVNWFGLVNGGDDGSSTATTTVSSTTKNLTSNENSDTKQKGDGDNSDQWKSIKLSQQNMYRMLVVLLTITVVTICFFTCKYLSSKKSKKTKKYGVLATSGADVELRPLDDDEEDEEDVFNINR